MSVQSWDFVGCSGDQSELRASLLPSQWGNRLSSQDPNERLPFTRLAIPSRVAEAQPTRPPPCIDPGTSQQLDRSYEASSEIVPGEDTLLLPKTRRTVAEMTGALKSNLGPKMVHVSFYWPRAPQERAVSMMANSSKQGLPP